MALHLHAGDLRLVLDPEAGGAIAALTWRGLDVLRPVSDKRLVAQQGRAVAGYPLIPFANRIAWGRFSVGGTSFQLARNFAGHPHPIHGNAWMRPWQVAESSGTRARLVLDHRPPLDPVAEWPFAYHAEQHFNLTDGEFSVVLSVRNDDDRAFPAGIGLHPYLARTPQTTLCFEADTVWTTGADSLPIARLAVQGEQEFDQAKPLGDTEIDSCFAGWGGSARIVVPEQGMAVQIQAEPPLDHFQVYTPSGQDYCGLEPVSNMPDAINRMETVSDQGMVLLNPGESLAGKVIFAVRPL